MRCAIVASGTRNARAISAVVRPPTARSVSATCDAGESAGWQQRNSSVERVVLLDRRLVAGAGATPARRTWAAAVSSRRRRACSLRSSSVSRRDATVISQPRGFSGTPSRGPLHGRGEQRLLHGVLGGVEVPVAPDERAEDLRRETAQQVLDAGGVRRHISVPDCPSAAAARRAAKLASGQRAAISVARSRVSQSSRQ